MESWESRVRDQDRAQVRACLTEAQKAGHTAKEAEECDDGSLECPECPFVTK